MDRRLTGLELIVGAVHHATPPGVDAEAVALAICEAAEGFTVPAPIHLERRRRNAAIRREFSGRNWRSLARRHGLSVRQVRRIVTG